MNTRPWHAIDEHRYARIGPRCVIVDTSPAYRENGFLPGHLCENQVRDCELDVGQGSYALIIQLLSANHGQRDRRIAELRLTASCGNDDLGQTHLSIACACRWCLSPRSSGSQRRRHYHNTTYQDRALRIQRCAQHLVPPIPFSRPVPWLMPSRPCLWP